MMEGLCVDQRSQAEAGEVATNEITRFHSILTRDRPMQRISLLVLQARHSPCCSQSYT